MKGGVVAYFKMINLACSNDWECMPGAEVSKGDVCFDNGRCRDGDCQNLCEYNGKVPCLCAEDNVVSCLSRIYIFIINLFSYC